MLPEHSPTNEQILLQKLAEQSKLAKQTESELAAIYDNAPVVMFIVNSEGKIVKLNKAALKINGLKIEAVIGCVTGELFQCQHAVEGRGQGVECQNCLINQGMLETLTQGTTNQGKTATLTTTTEQGPQTKHLKLSSTPIDYAGESMALICIDDITELIEQHNLQQESEKRAQHLYRQFETLLDAIDDPLCLLSKDVNLLWTNQAYRQLQETLDCDEDGLTFNHYFADSNDYPVQRCIKTGKMAEADITTIDNRTWQLRAFPLLDDAGQTQQVIVVALDISEKERLQEDAIRTSRLASLGMLAAGVAHEINNPNAFILYNSDILQGIFADLFPYLKQKMSSAEDVEFNGLSWNDVETELPGMLSAMQEGALRIKRIVDDLRDYARHETDDRFTALDINDIAATAARMVHNSLQKSTDHFSLELADSLPLIEGDFGRLEQVVINLLLNSCQALTNHTQAIKLKTFVNPEATNVLLQVIDEGQGIPPEILESITEPFTTTRHKWGGTGLGLSVSNRIVKAHAGQLKFESQPGQGTCVSLILQIPKAKE